MLKYLKMYYVLVALPYILLLIGAKIFFEPIKKTILNNPIPHLNYAIIVIVLTGGIFILINARRLVREARILKEFSAAIHAKTDSTTLREMANRYTGALACILQMVAATGDRSISHQEQAALEHELNNTRSSLVRRNALPQYLTGLLVAMGLLGTFIGLLATLADISVLIGGFADIDMNNIDPIQVFRVMIERMKAPMTSMGIAFSTSMFGLLGSIVIGLMMLGIRRIQGDIFSVLTSEVTRHIELALSFESISFRGGEPVGTNGEVLDLTAKILLRIEERLAESARVRQRALSAEIDDFKKQRAEMLQALTEQSEANNNFRSELQQLGTQFASIFNGMQKASGEISSQISELAVHSAGDAKETHKLLSAQIDEQKRLRDTFDSYNIKEWLAETARMQQRALSAEIDDFNKQRAEMVRTLAEQTEANKDLRSELKQIGDQLGNIFSSMEKSSDEVSAQISELTVHLGADAKESHRLLAVTNNNIRGELQKISSQLGDIRNASEKASGEMAKQVSELLQQLSGELDNISNVTAKGNGEIVSRISELMTHMSADNKESQQRAESAAQELRSELQKLGSQLGNISNVSERSYGEIAAQISDLTTHISADAKESLKQFDIANNGLRGELQQLGGQLDSILNATEKGGGEITTQISELLTIMAADAKDSQNQLSLVVKDEETLTANEQQP